MVSSPPKLVVVGLKTVVVNVSSPVSVIVRISPPEILVVHGVVNVSVNVCSSVSMMVSISPWVFGLVKVT